MNVIDAEEGVSAKQDWVATNGEVDVSHIPVCNIETMNTQEEEDVCMYVCMYLYTFTYTIQIVFYSFPDH